MNYIHITDKESAQNVPAPVTTYALFRDGQFLTQSIQSEYGCRDIRPQNQSLYSGGSD